LGSLLGLIALYAVNPSHRWSEGVGLLPVAHLRFLPASAFPSGTLGTLLQASAACAAFLLASSLSARNVWRLQRVLTIAAALLALMAMAQRLEQKPFPIFERTAIFVYENHFAAWANLTLPVVLALGARLHFRSVQEGRMSSPAGLCGLVALLLAAAVVLSRSRAGVAVMALLVAAHFGLREALLRRYPFSGRPLSRWIRTIGAGGVLAAVALAGFAVAREWHTLGVFRGEWNFRSTILKDTLAIWRDDPLWGTGPGTFFNVFPYFQSESLQGLSFRHAHCEPIQFLSEFGLAGSLWVLAAVGVALSARSTRKDGALPPMAELEHHAFGLGLLACALHGMIDFPLRNPLIWILAAAWAGVWVGTRPAPDSGPAVPMAQEEKS
jgi:O-antigen ligase